MSGSGSGSPGGSGNSRSGGLPQGAIITIVLLAIAVGLLAIFTEWWLVYDRRNKAQPPQLQSSAASPT